MTDTLNPFSNVNSGDIQPVATPSNPDETLPLESSVASGPQMTPDVQANPQATINSQPPQEDQTMPLAQQMIPQGMPKQQPQAHDKGGIFNSLLETLAGPAYKYQIDPKTGIMERTPMPRTKGQLAQSILAGALTGMFAGAGERGPGSVGRSAAKGFEAASGMRMQKDQQEQAMAVNDFQRRAAITQTNMRMAMNARAMANEDLKFHQAQIDMYKPVMDDYQKLGAVTDAVYDDDPEFFKKVDVTKHNGIPVAVEPKFDENGNPAGFRTKYAIVDPNVKIEIPDNVWKELEKYNVPGFVTSDGKRVNLPKDTALRAHVVLNAIEQAQTAKIVEGQYKKILGDTDTDTEQPQQAPATRSVPQHTVNNKFVPNINDKVDSYAAKYGLDKNLFRGLIDAESKGNPKAQSNAGAQGLGQLMPATQKKYNVTDPFDIDQNLNGSAQELKRLMDKYNGNPELALAAYNAGEGKVDELGRAPRFKETQGYLDTILGPNRDATNVTAKANTKEKNASLRSTYFADVESPLDALKGGKLSPRDFQTLMNIPGQLDAFFEGKPGEQSKAEQYASQSKNPDIIKSVSRIQAWLGKDNIDAYMQDRNIKAATEQEQAKAMAKSQAERDFLMQTQKQMEPPEGYRPDPNNANLSAFELRDKLKSEGVYVPPNFESLWGIAHYRDPMGNYASRIWAKGAPGEMDAQMAATYIRRYINPDFDQPNYQTRSRFIQDLYDERNGKYGSVIYNAGVATQHMQVLRDLSTALQNGDMQRANKLVNLFATETGNPKVTNFQAVADAVADETSKVFAGQAPFQQQVKEGRDRLRADFSPQQVEGVLENWTKLMHGRIKEIDDIASKKGPRSPGFHLDNVPPDVVANFKRYNLPTPFASGGEGPEGSGTQTNNATGQQTGTPIATIPAGAIPISQNGQIIGYSTDGGKSMTPIGISQ